LLIPHSDPDTHRGQLWTISYPKGEARRLTNDLRGYDSPLDMTHRGDVLAAISNSAISNVWVYAGADFREGRQITFGNLPMMDVAEAPDGKLLSTSGNGELWATPIDGSQRSILGRVQGAGWLTSCVGSLVLTSFESGSNSLLRVDTEGSHPMKLASGSLWSPSCSPDGRFVFYVTVDSPQKIWRVSIEGGAPVQIAEVLGDSISGRMSVSPDGRFIAYPYTRYSSSPGSGWSLVVIPAAGGPPGKAFDVPPGFSGVRWSPRGEGLQYLLTESGTSNIWEQPLAGGAPRQITKFGSGEIFEFNWSLDGRRLLLTRGEVSSDVVLLTNLR
jgi:Tol biopolymer transport system component